MRNVTDRRCFLKTTGALAAGIGLAGLAGSRTLAEQQAFTPRIKRRLDINVRGNVVMGKLSAMTDAELLKVIQEGVTQELLQLEAAEVIWPGPERSAGGAPARPVAAIRIRNSSHPLRRTRTVSLVS